MRWAVTTGSLPGALGSGSRASSLGYFAVSCAHVQPLLGWYCLTYDYLSILPSDFSSEAVLALRLAPIFHRRLF